MDEDEVDVSHNPLATSTTGQVVSNLASHVTADLDPRPSVGSEDLLRSQFGGRFSPTESQSDTLLTGVVCTSSAVAAPSSASCYEETHAEWRTEHLAAAVEGNNMNTNNRTVPVNSTGQIGINQAPMPYNQSTGQHPSPNVSGGPISSVQTMPSSLTVPSTPGTSDAATTGSVSPPPAQSPGLAQCICGPLCKKSSPDSRIETWYGKPVEGVESPVVVMLDSATSGPLEASNEGLSQSNPPVTSPQTANQVSAFTFRMTTATTRSDDVYGSGNRDIVYHQDMTSQYPARHMMRTTFDVLPQGYVMASTIPNQLVRSPMSMSRTPPPRFLQPQQPFSQGSRVGTASPHVTFAPQPQAGGSYHKPPHSTIMTSCHSVQPQNVMPRQGSMVTQQPTVVPCRGSIISQPQTVVQCHGSAVSQPSAVVPCRSSLVSQPQNVVPCHVPMMSQPKSAVPCHFTTMSQPKSTTQYHVLPQSQGIAPCRASVAKPRAVSPVQGEPVSHGQIVTQCQTAVVPCSDSAPIQRPASPLLNCAQMGAHHGATAAGHHLLSIAGRKPPRRVAAKCVQIAHVDGLASTCHQFVAGCQLLHIANVPDDNEPMPQRIHRSRSPGEVDIDKLEPVAAEHVTSQQIMDELTLSEEDLLSDWVRPEEPWQTVSCSKVAGTRSAGNSRVDFSGISTQALPSALPLDSLHDSSDLSTSNSSLLAEIAFGIRTRQPPADGPSPPPISPQDGRSVSLSKMMLDYDDLISQSSDDDLQLSLGMMTASAPAVTCDPTHAGPHGVCCRCPSQPCPEAQRQREQSTTLSEQRQREQSTTSSEQRQREQSTTSSEQTKQDNMLYELYHSNYAHMYIPNKSKMAACLRRSLGDSTRSRDSEDKSSVAFSVNKGSIKGEHAATKNKTSLDGAMDSAGVPTFTTNETVVEMDEPIRESLNDSTVALAGSRQITDQQMAESQRLRSLQLASNLFGTQSDSVVPHNADMASQNVTEEMASVVPTFGEQFGIASSEAFISDATHDVPLTAHSIDQQVTTTYDPSETIAAAFLTPSAEEVKEPEGHPPTGRKRTVCCVQPSTKSIEINEKTEGEKPDEHDDPVLEDTAKRDTLTQVDSKDELTERDVNPTNNNSSARDNPGSSCTVASCERYYSSVDTGNDLQSLYKRYVSSKIDDSHWYANDTQGLDSSGSHYNDGDTKSVDQGGHMEKMQAISASMSQELLPYTPPAGVMTNIQLGMMSMSEITSNISRQEHHFDYSLPIAPSWSGSAPIDQSNASMAVLLDSDSLHFRSAPTGSRHSDKRSKREHIRIRKRSHLRKTSKGKSSNSLALPIPQKRHIKSGRRRVSSLSLTNSSGVLILIEPPSTDMQESSSPQEDTQNWFCSCICRGKRSDPLVRNRQLSQKASRGSDLDLDSTESMPNVSHRSSSVDKSRKSTEANDDDKSDENVICEVTRSDVAAALKEIAKQMEDQEFAKVKSKQSIHCCGRQGEQCVGVDGVEIRQNTDTESHGAVAENISDISHEKYPSSECYSSYGRASNVETGYEADVKYTRKFATALTSMSSDRIDGLSAHDCQLAASKIQKAYSETTPHLQWNAVCPSNITPLSFSSEFQRDSLHLSNTSHLGDLLSFEDAMLLTTAANRRTHSSPQRQLSSKVQPRETLQLHSHHLLSCTFDQHPITVAMEMMLHEEEASRARRSSGDALLNSEGGVSFEFPSVSLNSRCPMVAELEGRRRKLHGCRSAMFLKQHDAPFEVDLEANVDSMQNVPRSPLTEESISYPESELSQHVLDETETLHNSIEDDAEKPGDLVHHVSLLKHTESNEAMDENEIEQQVEPYSGLSKSDTCIPIAQPDKCSQLDKPRKVGKRSTPRMTKAHSCPLLVEVEVPPEVPLTTEQKDADEEAANDDHDDVDKLKSTSMTDVAKLSDSLRKLITDSLLNEYPELLGKSFSEPYTGNEKAKLPERKTTQSLSSLDASNLKMALKYLYEDMKSRVNRHTEMEASLKCTSIVDLAAAVKEAPQGDNKNLVQRAKKCSKTERLSTQIVQNLSDVHKFISSICSQLYPTLSKVINLTSDKSTDSDTEPVSVCESFEHIAALARQLKHCRCSEPLFNIPDRKKEDPSESGSVVNLPPIANFCDVTSVDPSDNDSCVSSEPVVDTKTGSHPWAKGHMRRARSTVGELQAAIDRWAKIADSSGDAPSAVLKNSEKITHHSRSRVPPDNNKLKANKSAPVIETTDRPGTSSPTPSTKSILLRVSNTLQDIISPLPHASAVQRVSLLPSELAIMSQSNDDRKQPAPSDILMRKVDILYGKLSAGGILETSGRENIREAIVPLTPAECILKSATNHAMVSAADRIIRGVTDDENSTPDWFLPSLDLLNADGNVTGKGMLEPVKQPTIPRPSRIPRAILHNKVQPEATQA